MFEHVGEDCQCEGKQCTRCLVTRCQGEFSKDKHLKSGLKSICKICNRERVKLWHQQHVEHEKAYQEAHKERQRERGRAYYQNNKEKFREYRQSHAEAIQKYKKEWWQKHYLIDKARRDARREQINERRRVRYHNNPEPSKNRSRAYKLEHPNHYREYARAYPEIIRTKTAHRRARKKNATGTYTVKEWQSLKEQYEYTCLCCGLKEPEIKLTIDHVVPLIRGGSNTIDNIQPLCFSCNSKKRAKIVDYRLKKELKDGFQS